MLKSFQFKATRIERYVVSCYEGELGGFFRAHRDNTTKGTAHRKFACISNRVGAHIAIGLQHFGQTIAINPRAGREVRGQLPNAEGR